MQITDLMMLNDDDIDYSSLSEDTLKALALGEELFMANSALVELAIRHRSLAAELAFKILENSLGDSYLKATALEIMVNNNREKAIELIQSQIHTWDEYMLNTVREIIAENQNYFKSAVVRQVIERLKEFDVSANFPEALVADK